MDISIVKVLPDNVIKALCNTLIHSLWQGLVLSAVAGMVIVFTRRATAALRYNLLVVSLSLFAGATVYTFVSQLHMAQVVEAAKPALNKADMVETIQTQINIRVIPATVTDQMVNYFNSHAQMIVLIWFLIVCARSIQLLTGLQGIYQLKKRSVFAVADAWQDRVNELSAKLGIYRTVGVVESGLAKVPMVAGHFKPMILIPMGLITALPPAEIDAILVHELAHIHRRDYLVNLLQGFMEIVFFFNPAVLWISALIRNERENCCDDIAIAQTSSKTNYIKALISCQEYRLSAPAYAMALSGNKSHLLNRVKRMVSNSNQSLNLMEKSMLAVCLLMAGLVTTAFSNADKINKLISTTSKAITHVSKAIKMELSPQGEPVEKVELPLSTAEIKPGVTLPADTLTPEIKIYTVEDMHGKQAMKRANNGLVSYLWNEDGKFYQANVGEGALQSVQVNGKTLKDDEIALYKPTIDKVIARHEADKLRSEQQASDNQMTANEANLGNLNGSLGTRLAAINVNIGNHVKLQVDSIMQAEKRILVAVPAPVALAIPAYAYSKQPLNYNTTPYSARSAQYNTTQYKPHHISKDDSLRNAIINEMVGDGIIKKNDANLSFKLSTSEFIINGKKQPDDVYQKYRSEYVKVTGHDEWSWYYNYDTLTEKKTEKKTKTTVN